MLDGRSHQHERRRRALPRHRLGRRLRASGVRAAGARSRDRLSVRRGDGRAARCLERAGRPRPRVLHVRRGPRPRPATVAGGAPRRPRARRACTHSYEFDKGRSKWFWLERNRWRTVLSVYPGAVLALTAPACSRPSSGCSRSPRGWLAAKLRAQAATLRGLPGMLPTPNRCGRRPDERAIRGCADEWGSTRLSSAPPPGCARSPPRRPPTGGWCAPRCREDRPPPRVLRQGRAVRVGLDLLFLKIHETGGRETYARELVRGLAAERPDSS